MPKVSRRFRERAEWSTRFTHEWMDFPNGTYAFRALPGGGYTLPKYEWIEDSLQKRDRNSKDLPMGDVDHIKLWCNDTRRLIHTGAEPSGVSLRVELDAGIPLVPYWAASLQHRNELFPLPPQSELTDFGLAAHAEFTTQFPEEISILNFLWELRELPEMVSSAVIRAYALKKQIEIEYGVAAAASDVLAWEFGWGPFIQDLRTIFSVLDKILKRLDYLRSTKGKPVKAGFSRGPIVAESHFETTLGNAPPYVQLAEYSTWRVWNRCSLRAGCRITNNLPYLDDIRGTLYALLGGLGFLNPAKVVWNALPFSFCVDWLLGVGNWLSAYAGAKDASGNWIVDRLCWSFKSVSSFEVRVKQANPWIPSLQANDVLWTFMGTRYVRREGLPIDPWVIKTPTAKQIALSAALVTGSSRN